MSLSRRALPSLEALIPVLFLAALTLWAGTFALGATAEGAVTAHALVLGICLLGGRAWRDPLALGGAGRWLPPALFLIAGTSLALGPVPRAGVVGVLLLPAFFLLPAAVESCWRTPERMRLGLAALGLLLAAVSAIALGLWWEQGSPRAAMPLGHHNLLATWLILVWPVGLVGLVRRPGSRPYMPLAVILGLAALAGTGSFLAVGAFLAQGFLIVVMWRPARLWVIAAAVTLLAGPWLGDRALEWWESRRPAGAAELAVVASGEASAANQSRSDSVGSDALARASQMLAGGDSSVRARSVYYGAGWRGIESRPLVGWGPGSVPLTIARFTRPVAGVNPAGEVVGDLHSLPLQVAYEMGWPGVAIAAAIPLLFTARRVREARRLRDRMPLEAALVGLAGGGVMLLGNAPLAVLAVPGALAVVSGAALAGTERCPIAGRRSYAALGVLYVLPVAIVLGLLGYAHFLYQGALSSKDREEALADVRRAAELDSGFALYRARSAWLAAESGGLKVVAAEEALLAAEAGYRLAPLWLSAGVLGLEANRPWAAEALERAVALDPLSPIAAFHLMRANPVDDRAVELGVRAVLGDPRLGDALWWDQNPDLRRRVAERLPPGLRDSFPARSRSSDGDTALLVQSLDRRSATSFSLFAFRRSPWPADLAPVEVRIGTERTASAGARLGDE